ncbi:3-oxoadipate enol-lactonase [Muricauda sp. 334s03]|uniref:3-oxoadipate enol-lactonase n=1 Tax=Flagellimonas yonaguniensis TaxID=3031325 RepID=A0ABT5Y223_9FLAO|nr:3-oxoadipate enol-lactonase [[Muricauda] yonaguniensis]MDF0717497.1 3-oxoadipate enol-lactonase [[Muricauda] yonaguniensis]
MAVAKVNNVKIHYQYKDHGHEEVLIFSNSLGCNLSMWSYQEMLKEHFNILTYDTRGHGDSEITLGKYTVELLGNDVLALADHLNIEKFNFCGLSMGGLIGQWLGIHAGNRLNHLIIANTAAKIGTETGWNDRIQFVNHNKMADLVDGSKVRWFTPEYCIEFPQEVSKLTDQIANTSPDGYVANCAVVRDADFREQLHKIKTPTLIISGTKDEVTTVEHGKFLNEQIKDSEHVSLNAAHLSNVEQAEGFSEYILNFIKE